MPDIKIPALGESVAGGQIAKWHFKEGDAVKAGDVLLTLETDKVAAEVTAEVSGTLHIGKPEGEDVEVGAVVGAITEGAALPAAPPVPTPPSSSAPAESAAEAPAPPKPAAAPNAEPPNVEPANVEPANVEPAKPAAAAEKPANVTEFRVVPKDKVAPAVPADKPPPEGRVTRKKMTPLRRKIADQLVNAQQTAAILTTFNECDMSGVLALRAKVQDGFVAKHGVKLGFMSFFVKAVVEALKAVPAMNVRVEGDEIVQHHFYDIGVAVGTERGLIVPVIRDCDTKSFADIEKDILGYAGKAKEGKIELGDLTGGIFTISNGGVYGSLLSTPILNPPQSGILGMHTIQQRPMAVDGQVVIRPMMYLALSYDHRVVDGREAVTFLIRVKDCIENPARMLVGA